MRARVFVCTGLFALGGALPARAQSGPRFLEDAGHIVVIEHDGQSYDRDTPAGELNAAPRQAIARKLIGTHGDFYDFIVVFTNFDFDRGGAIGFYSNVRNDVTGIHLPVGDNGGGFGSPARLQGFIDMGPIGQYRVEPFSLDPASPGFRRALGVLAHEVGHRWLAGVRFDSGGGPRTDLLGRDGAHWSFLLSSGASFLYGNAWEPAGGSLYRSVEVESRFSELDLYLMGFLAPEDVSPLTLLVNPDVDKTRLPELGAEVEALTTETVTIEDILAAEGPRLPGHGSSQKDFAALFVLLAAERTRPTAADLEGVERIRARFMDTFFGLTRGQALVDTDLQAVVPLAPGALPDTRLALSWLLGEQQADGRFEAHRLTGLRDTATAVGALETLGVRGAPVDHARAWMSSQNPATVDYLARTIVAGADVPFDRLVMSRNADGGFGITPGYRSEPLDTALALTALADSALGPEIADVLATMQLPDGSFSSIAGQPGDVMTTSEATGALARAGGHDLAVQNALAWLVSRQQEDGGFGDGPSTPYATALSLEALLAGTAPTTAIDRALAYLQQTQRADGSWNESVFETAAALRALVPSTFANLSIGASDIALDPDPPEVGETARIEVTVRNRSRVLSGPFDVQLFDGDPEAGGLAIGAPVLVNGLEARSTHVATFSWDTTGLEGAHTLFAVADFAGGVSEISKDDNVAVRDVVVLPPLPNLVVAALTAAPPNPIAGSGTTLTARIENRGSLASGGTRVRFYRETPRLGIELGDFAVSALEPGSSADVSVVWTAADQLGSHTLFAVVDPADDVRERIETDNEASLRIDVRAPPPAQPDLEILDFALAPNELDRLPQNVTARARIANTGLDPVPSLLVELFLGPPDLGGVLVTSRTLAVGGDTAVDVALDFTVTYGGTRTYFLRVGAGAVVERDDTNNVASATLRDPMDVVDVTLVPGTLALSASSVNPGAVVFADVRVRNSGTRPLSSVAVALFYEVASGGPFRLASTRSLPLSPGASELVRLSWTANRSGTVPLELRVDPDDVLSETREDDNVLASSVDVTVSTLPNLSLASSDITVKPVTLAEGMAATLEARVRNTGDADAGPFDVTFFAGDPARDGFAIGSALVPSLAAGADTVVSVSWNPVNVRGEAFLFAEADSAADVDEIDERDNLTFRVVDILGLPDLLATAGQLRLTPAFPRSGDGVSIDASFTNGGEQAAERVVAEIRLDDPDGGTLLATETFSGMAPGASASFTASWDTTGVTGEHAIYLVLDAFDTVLEQREDNNAVRVPVALQDGDVFVTPLYFSPNGDGVQDEAAFFFRVSATGALRVEVRDGDESVVRTLAPEPGESAGIVWDGRDKEGALARDGSYFFVLLDEGAEVLRRRVVLDTNRSSVVEALGSDLVSFTELTCPLPPFVEGPAWLPGDRAAYVIVTIADPVAAPDYPVGLYRVTSDARSLELVLADAAFSGMRFADEVPGSRAQRLRAVSAGGERALVRSAAEGLQILDLSTGARTPLGHDDLASAQWSSDGRRILVGSSTGLFFYDANGVLLRTLVSADVDLALLTPDELRILYRRSDEIALRIVNADGSGDHLLASTDASALFDEVPVPDDLDLSELYFADESGPVFAWFFQSREEEAGPFEIDPDADTLSSAASRGELSGDGRWELGYSGTFHVATRVAGRESRPILPLSLGNELHWSYRDTHISYRGDGGEGCVGRGIWAVRSLLNGEAALRLVRLPSGFGVQIVGTVADQNLDVYTLDYAPVESPDAFVPIQPPSSDPVMADTLTTWIPPGPGDYLVRLTLRDRAGNVTERLERIFWEETLPIASLRRAPAYLSPNGDGVQDEVLVEYDVLAPANLVFTVRDSKGRSVRRIERDELVPGPASFLWDGTDDPGVTVEDGRYVIELRGAELPVIVDATPPDVAAAYSELYTRESPGSRPRLAVDLEGHLVDANLDVWELTTFDGELLESSRREIGSTTESAVVLEGLRPVQGLEIRARDRAGNASVVPLAGPSREVRIVAARSEAIGPLEPGPASPVPPQIISSKRPLSLGAESAFTGALRFQYARNDDTTVIELPVTRSLTLGTDVLELGTKYAGHFEADGIVSQEVEFTVGPDAIFLSTASVPAGAREVELILSQTIEEPLVEGWLRRTSGEVVKAYRHVPRGDRIVVPVPPCGITQGYLVEATGASGLTYRSTTALAYPEASPLAVSGRDCLSVDDAGIEAQAAPGAPRPNEALAFVESSGAAGAETLVLLLDDGVSVTEVGRTEDVQGGAGVLFDVTSLPEGAYSLRTRAIREGVVVEGDFGLDFVLDQSPPEATIVSPAEGAGACVVTVDGRSVVLLDVLARDREIAGLGVERLLADDTWEPLGIVDPPALPVTGEIATTLPVIVPRDLEGEVTLRLVAKNRRIVSERAERPWPIPGPPPPGWPDAANNGGLVAADVRTLVFSPALALGPLVTDPAAPALFSPNEDGIADTMAVSGEALEAVSMTVRVRTTTAAPVIIRTIEADTPVGAGPFRVVWDGRDALGLAVPDGEYTIELEAVNGCGGTSSSTVRVEVDTTPPTVVIEEPVDDQPISVGVEVTGVAFDDHFESYVLELGEGAAPLTFTPVTLPVLHQVRASGALGNWSAGNLSPGIYTLRLVGTDRVGNRASTQVRVEVLAADFIARNEAAPAVFSPNGDAVQDTTALHFELKADARVTLAILDASDAVVASLLDGVVLTSGIHDVIWDGLGVPDGDYTALLRAESPTAATLFEESRLSLAVDTVPPRIAIASPVAGGFVALPADVNGSITDDHLERYVVDVGPTTGALETVAEDSVPAAGVLTVVRSLPDGSYRLHASASDQAGNASEHSFPFDVDTTSPALAIKAPVSGAFLTRPPESVSVLGSVTEANLSRYDLELGFGDPPDVFVPLATGTSLPGGDSLATWNLDALPDGRYALRLTAIDRAQNFAVVETHVVLDASPPTVLIEAPASGAVVSGPVTVRGTLADGSLESASLSVAPADRPDAATELAAFSSPIAGGTLLEGLTLEDGDYLLVLQAQDRAGNVSSASSPFAVDTEPPLPPGALAATPGETAVTLSWSASPSPDVAGYHVSRDGARITDTPLPGTGFVDPDLAEGLYRYTVLAVDRAGLESEPSASVRARIDLTPPNVSLRSPDEGARVRVEVDVVGTAFSESDFLEYRLSVAPGKTPFLQTLLKRSSVPVSFDTLGLWRPLADGNYILTLEAEDTSGNVASESVRVTADNTPPDAPVLLRAEALPKPDDIEIEWSGPSDADLAGFLVFRNGRIANAPGNVSGSLEPFIVPGPTFVDAGLPDGEHGYRVAAMDAAGNLSNDSNELSVFLDNREPRAVLVDPADGARFDAPRALLAKSDDLDVATVSFEYRPAGEAFWTVIGIDGDGAPFETLWDVTGLAFGDYDLRAVATDAGTRSDPAPELINVTLGDVTPPSPPASLTARADGETVALSWTGVSDTDLTGYRLFRDGALVLELGAGAVTATDTGVPDGTHDYTLRALDGDGNESDASNTATVRVYAPVLLPGFPVFEAASTTLAGAGAEPGAAVRLFESGTSVEIAATTADGSGGFELPALGLSLGPHVLAATATDDAGNASRPSSEALLIRNDLPPAPTGFTAVPSGDSALLSWNAVTDPDLSGYLVTRDGEVRNTRGLLRPTGAIPTGHVARASVNQTAAARVIGPGSWVLDAGVEGWIEIELAEPRHLDEVRIAWTFGRSAKDYDLLVELEGRLVPIARFRDEASTSRSAHRLPIPIQTTRVRLHIFSSATPFAVLVDELELVGILPETTTTFTDRPMVPGLYAYAVESIDTLGGRSVPAGPLTIGVGDLSPPEPPPALTATVTGEDVLLSWTESPSPDVTRYRVLRDGESIRTTSATSLIDADLRNGTYAYNVIAIDGVGNESPPSSTALATVDVAPPSAPVLRVATVPRGRALALDWTESLGPLGVSQYVILRAETAGGPYVEIASVGGTSLFYEDFDVTNGVRYFYVVGAIDVRGEPSELSNEVSAVPADTVAPPAPVWIAPSSPQTRSASRITLLGVSEPGSTVDVFRQREAVSSGLATSGFTILAEPSVATTFNVSGRFALSPDRNLIAEMGTRFGDPEARIYDLRTGAVRVLPYAEDGSFARDAAFSPDGRRVAVTTTLGSFRAIRVLDLETGTTEIVALADVPNTLSWISTTELAVVMAGADIRAVDVATGAETILYSSSGLEPQSLAASPGGAYLAWRERNALYVVPSSGGTPTVVFNGFGLGEHAWTGERTLVFNVSGLGIHFFDVDTETTKLVAATENLTRPGSLGAPGVVSAFDGSRLVWVYAEGGVVELGDVPESLLGGFLAWSSELALVGVTPGFTLAILETPGRVELEARLVPGVNFLTGRATDEAANAGPDSAVLELTYEPSGLSDLTVDGALLIVPAAPVSGETASISVPILNRGASPSLETSLTVSGADPDGNLYTIDASAIPALEPGGRTIRTLSWHTAGRFGNQTILATIDPLELLDEADETNNEKAAEATVVGASVLELTIGTGRPAYASGQTVELTVTAVNGGANRDVVLDTRVEDASGTLVASIDDRPVSLAYAGSTRYAVLWTPGAVTAGGYVARVLALDARGETMASASVPFELSRTLALALDVTTDRPAYTQGDAVRLLARVADVGGNAPLRDLSLRFRILDPAAANVLEEVQSIGYLAMGGAISSEAVWPSGADTPGVYRLAVEAFEGSELVASSEAAFELAAATSVTLAGTMTFDADAVPSGSNVVVTYTIANESILDLTGGTVRIELFDPVTAAILAADETALTVPGKGSAVGTLRLGTTGLELGRKAVVLSAGGATLSSLATAPVVLFGTPAAPSLNAPANGASAPQRLRLSVNNATNPNHDTLTYEFELFLEPSLTTRIASASGFPEGTSTTVWPVLSALQENRRYYWRARAADAYATSDWMAPAEVFVDSANEPPGPPSLSSPPDTSEVDVLRPSLVVGSALDPENGVLTYAFEIYRDSGLSDLVLGVSGVAETSGTTSFAVPSDLDEDTTYYWRARANDGELDGEWMPAASFRVNTSNQAPTAPVPLAPVDVRVPALTPELSVLSAVDPEGDPITHSFQIDVTPSFDSAARQDSPPLADVRWTPPAPLDENGVYFWRARASDGLSAGAWSTAVTFRVDVANEPPGAPTPQRPAEGAVVESATPVVAVVNALDPEDDPLTYTFEVYEDPALTTLAASVTSLPEGTTETAWAVTPRLSEETTYYWIARAHDGTAAGPATLPQTFRVNVMNEEPSAPVLASPAEGAVVADLAPTLAVTNASDPDGDPLSYRFEVYEDELLTIPIEDSGEIAEGATETSWTMSATLEENKLYYWRARAFDGRLESAWMATARFRFSLTNEAPSSPMPVSPPDGDVVAESRPVLVIAPSTDPEDDALAYAFELFRDAGLTDRVIASLEIEETSWMVGVDLDENASFYWRASASDGDRSSPPSAVFQFTVNAVDEPPTTPVLASPADGAIVPTPAPVLTVANATSPDGPLGEPLVYHFVLYADAALSDVVAEDEAVPEDGSGQTRWEPAVTLNPGATYYWRARAIDVRGLASEWATAFSFVVEPPASDCPPEWKDGFERYRAFSAPSGWRLERERLRPRFYVRPGARGKRLVSSVTGRGSLLFAGSGEAFGWRNYELQGELRARHLGHRYKKRHHPPACRFSTGVVFYANPEEGTSYRLELTGARCKHPKARLTKITGGDRSELTRIDLARHFDEHAIRFHIEAVNHPSSTSLLVRLEGGRKNGRDNDDDDDDSSDDDEHDAREWTLAFEDTEAPLRSGTVGAWASFARAAWDDFHVREIPGLPSGISGDADGDGVCDIDLEGESCGASHFERVGKRTNVLHVTNPGVAPRRFRLRLVVPHHLGALEAKLPDGSVVTIGTRPVELTVPPGDHVIRLSAQVFVRGFRWERLCR